MLPFLTDLEADLPYVCGQRGPRFPPSICSSLRQPAQTSGPEFEEAMRRVEVEFHAAGRQVQHGCMVMTVNAMRKRCPDDAFGEEVQSSGNPGHLEAVTE